MTPQRLQPCPRCSSTNVASYKYDNRCWHSECDACFVLGPAASTEAQAAREWNAIASEGAAGGSAAQ